MGKIASACDRCGRPYRVDAGHAGKKGRCAGCGNIFRIPGMPAPAPAPVPAPPAVPAASLDDGLDEGPATPRAPAPPVARPSPPRGPGWPARVRSAWRRWDRATGRDTETEEIKGLSRLGFPMIFFGASVALMPRTGWVIRGLPAVAHPIFGGACIVVGIVAMAAFALSYPLRALRKLLELLIIFGAVMLLTFFVIKPLVWDPRL